MGAKGLGGVGAAPGAVASSRSRFTSDEFSPRNDDGDFLVPPTVPTGGDDGLAVKLSPGRETILFTNTSYSINI